MQKNWLKHNLKQRQLLLPNRILQQVTYIEINLDHLFFFLFRFLNLLLVCDTFLLDFSVKLFSFLNEFEEPGFFENLLVALKFFVRAINLIRIESRKLTTLSELNWSNWRNTICLARSLLWKTLAYRGRQAGHSWLEIEAYISQVSLRIIKSFLGVFFREKFH